MYVCGFRFGFSIFCRRAWEEVGRVFELLTFDFPFFFFFFLLLFLSSPTHSICLKTNPPPKNHQHGRRNLQLHHLPLPHPNSSFPPPTSTSTHHLLPPTQLAVGPPLLQRARPNRRRTRTLESSEEERDLVREGWGCEGTWNVDGGRGGGGLGWGVGRGRGRGEEACGGGGVEVEEGRQGGREIEEKEETQAHCRSAPFFPLLLPLFLRTFSSSFLLVSPSLSLLGAFTLLNLNASESFEQRMFSFHLLLLPTRLSSSRAIN